MERDFFLWGGDQRKRKGNDKRERGSIRRRSGVKQS
jgi:hypothetical protein